MAITCVVPSSGWDKRLKIWRVLKDNGLCPISPEHCEAIQLTETQAEEFAAKFEDFVIPHEPEDVKNPFWVIPLKVEFERGVRLLNSKKVAHAKLPDETISEHPPIPAEVHDFLVWPSTPEEELAITATFRPMSIAA